MDLGALDITPPSIPKTGYVFHAQKMFAKLGLYYANRRSPDEVVLPNSVVNRTAVAVRNRSNGLLGGHLAQTVAARHFTTSGAEPTPSQNYVRIRNEFQSVVQVAFPVRGEFCVSNC